MTLQERMSESVELRRRAAIVRGYLENGRNIDGMPVTDHTGRNPNDMRREIERLRGENETLRAICRALLPENWKEQLEEEHK